MSDMVPEGWEKKRLSDFSTARRGTTYVSSELSEDKERFPLYINMKSFKVGGGYSENGDKYFTSPYSPNQLVQDNDLLIANTDVTDSCDILGAPAYVPREKLKNDVLFSHHISALNISDDVSLDFLNFLMCSEHIRLEMKRYGRGTTVKMLDMRDIGKISLSIPPLPEQKKIAFILTSVDEVIEKTQLQIYKLQDLKNATMNELLTKGIGHTEFKDSKLGRIPKSWEVCRLGDILTEKPSYGANASATNNNFATVRYIRITDVNEYGLLKIDSTAFIKDSDAEGYLLANDDLLIARTGNTVGKTYLHEIGKFDSTTRFAYAGYLIRFRLNNERAIPKYIFQYTLSKFFKDWVKENSRVGAQPNINAQEYSSFFLSLPNLEEQNSIVSILNCIDKNIEIKKEKLSQTQSLKKSLMQDLLTGKVRVTVN